MKLVKTMKLFLKRCIGFEFWNYSHYGMWFIIGFEFAMEFSLEWVWNEIWIIMKVGFLDCN
jgi:hypothetical protein